MKKAFLTTYQNGKQLLGSDYSRVVHNLTPRTLRVEQNLLNTSLQRLVRIKPHLASGWILKVETA